MRNKKFKGEIQGAMLMFIIALIIGLIIFGVFILFHNEEVQTGGIGVTFAKGMCGFLNIITGGFFSFACNLV